MGISAGGKSGGPKSDINVTPLVDVCLVLLIIFLVTMPIVMRNVPFEVPKKAEENTPPELLPDTQVVIEWKSDGRLLMNGEEINRTDLATRVRERLERKREKTVFVDFDDSVKYGDAVGVMDTCKGAGATTVALKMKEPAAPAEGTPGSPASPGPGSP